MFQWLRKIHVIHDWVTIRNTYKHKYQMCAHPGCIKRRIIDTMPGYGHQPVDQDWLKGHE